MSMGADEFLDLMPNEIQVTSKSTRDDFAYEAWDAATTRSYRCLIDDSDIVQVTVDGVNLNIGLTAYVNAIPIGHTTPVDIFESDQVSVISPVFYSNRVHPIGSLARHYWTDGSLHNMEVRLK